MIRTRIFIAVTFIGLLSITSCQLLSSESDDSKNVELQKIEIDIQQKIAEGDKNGAFDLLKTLVHPSSNYWSEKSTTYNEWWSSRRELLQIEISLMENSTSKQNESASGSGESNDENSELVSDSLGNETSVSESIDLPANLIGLYVMQFANGSTRFYKFFKDSKGISGVVYQDNVSGNVRVENYAIRSFNESTKEVNLESKKNPGSLTKVRFVQELDSENGFKVLDSEGASYSLVGN